MDISGRIRCRGQCEVCLKSYQVSKMNQRNFYEADAYFLN